MVRVRFHFQGLAPPRLGSFQAPTPEILNRSLANEDPRTRSPNNPEPQVANNELKTPSPKPF